MKADVKKTGEPAPAGPATACFPTGCTEETEADPATRLCYYDTHCSEASGGRATR